MVDVPRGSVAGLNSVCGGGAWKDADRIRQFETRTHFAAKRLCTMFIWESLNPHSLIR